MNTSTSMLPRPLHAGAWWLWAVGLAIAASTTTNPILLLWVVAALAIVVHSRKPDAPWARSFSFFVKLGLVVVAIRVIFGMVFGTPIGSTVLFTIPVINLPDWLAGLRLGGQFTVESLVFSACDGLRLAVILMCIGAANSLASPARLLKSLPAALYEVGVAVVVAMTFAPQLVADVQRVRQARRLRGRASTGLRGILGTAMPVFEGALDRAVNLAAAMESRGYGRTRPVAPSVRVASSLFLLGGLLVVLIGLFALLSASGSVALNGSLVALGLVATMAGVWIGGQRAIRTTYRPDPWWGPEWLTALSGVIAAAALIATRITDPVALTIAVTPLAWPTVSALAVVGIAVAAIPAVATPIPTATRPTVRQEVLV